MIYEMIKAFVATFTLAVIFDVNRTELIFCGVAGVIAEGVFQLAVMYGIENSLCVIIAAAAVTTLARALANIRKVPVTVYLVPGIIPLVPGAGMYNTVFELIDSQYYDALNTGINTLKNAVAIAIGIVIIFALPNKIFFKRK